MKYEYDVVMLNLSDEQQQVAQMGLGDIAQLNTVVCDAINERAKANWEPLYPFSVPQLWFRREVKVRKRAPARKKITKKTRQSTRK